MPSRIGGVIVEWLGSEAVKTAMVASFFQIGGVAALPGSWHDKSPAVQTALQTICATWIAAILGPAYIRGKAMEGTVPEGRQSSGPSPAAAGTINMGPNSTVNSAGATSEGATAVVQPAPAAKPAETQAIPPRAPAFTVNQEQVESLARLAAQLLMRKR